MDYMTLYEAKRTAYSSYQALQKVILDTQNELSETSIRILRQVIEDLRIASSHEWDLRRL